MRNLVKARPGADLIWRSRLFLSATSADFLCVLCGSGFCRSDIKPLPIAGPSSM